MVFVRKAFRAFPAEVTPQMVLNFLYGGAAVNVLARHAGADVVCVDIGVNADLDHPNLVSRKVRKGTRNMAKEAALSMEETVQAIQAGSSRLWTIWWQKGIGFSPQAKWGLGIQPQAQRFCVR